MEIDWYYDKDGCDNDPVLSENEILIQVPFIGTYEALDRCIDSNMECEADWRESENLPPVDYKFRMRDYLVAYVGEISDICKLPSLKFQYLSSPAYYNFETDKIVCSVDKNELWKLYSEGLPVTHYDHAVREATTPRDGYSPYYSEDDCYYESADDFVDNSAVLGLILEAYLNCWLHEEVDDYYENLLSTWELFIHMDYGNERYYEFLEPIEDEEKI